MIFEDPFTALEADSKKVDIPELVSRENEQSIMQTYAGPIFDDDLHG